MTKIIKWLKANGIDFTVAEDSHSKVITIIIESDCIWVNGFGKDMHYDKKITIRYDKSKPSRGGQSSAESEDKK